MKQLDFPEIKQTYKWDCGADVLEAVLTYYGIEIREELLIDYAKTNCKTGTSKKDMLRTLEKFDLKYDARSMTIEDLKNYIDKNIPVVILLQVWNKKGVIDYKNDFHDGHWVAAIGHNKDEIIFEDPYVLQRTFLKKEELEERWHDKEGDSKIYNFGIAVFGKKPAYNQKKLVHMN